MLKWFNERGGRRCHNSNVFACQIDQDNDLGWSRGRGGNAVPPSERRQRGYN